MSFALLWIEVLAACLLWVAMLTALVGRKGRRAFVTWVALLCLFPLAALASVTVVTGYLKFEEGFRINYFYYFCSLLIAFLAGVVVTLVGATRPGTPASTRAAGDWPRARLALAFLTASAVGGMTIWNMDLAARAAAEAGRTDAGAIMLSVAPPVVADDRNAAFLYQRAFDRLAADPAATRLESDSDDDLPGPNTPETAELLGRQATTLRLLRQAGGLPECRFDHDYAHPSFSTLLPELKASRTCARLLRMDARHALGRGSAPTAIEDVNATMQLSRHVGREPILVSLLVSLGIEKSAIDTLESVLPSVTQERQLAPLHVGDVAEPRRVLRRACLGEEALGLSVFSDVAGERLGFGNLAGDPRGDVLSLDYGPMPMFFRVFFLPGELEDYRRCLNHFQQQQLGPGSFPTTAKIKADAHDELVAARAGVLSQILVPSLSRVELQTAKSEALRADALVAVAMTRYRIDHGAYPDRLSLLVPDYLDELPADPFDGKAIRLVQASDRWTIYSIGPDGVDDGGKALNGQQDTGDLIFTLKMPGAAPASKPNGQ